MTTQRPRTAHPFPSMNDLGVEAGWARSFGLSEAPREGRTQSRPPAVMIWTAVFVVIAMLVALLVWTAHLEEPGLRPDGAATVPSVVGKTAADATKELSALGFQVEQQPAPNPSDAAAGSQKTGGEPGTVASSEPAAGFVAASGTRVVLHIVPDAAPPAATG
ncbi:PASTA domain-containing protein [Plantibacter sp. Mn2098]|uniref:PASTA domain-containing protein n=1 Tax=Plantibacter sp. Mn2098 TaxID=3395266 RepID=UPI003BE10439